MKYGMWHEILNIKYKGVAVAQKIRVGQIATEKKMDLVGQMIPSDLIRK